MKRILFAIFGFILTFGNLAAEKFKDETLKYVITYKWGLIQKDAGEATLTIKEKGDHYDLTLTAKNKSWADKLYHVRDTLKGKVRVSDFKPLSYTKLTHEKGEFKKDEVIYSHSGESTTGIARRYRKDDKNKDKMTVSEQTFTATGPVYDMLSVFYVIRRLDFKSLSRDKTYTATVFSGKQKETVFIRNLGIEKVKLKDKTEKEAYHLRLNFTRKGGTKSSDDMDTWISTDAAHTPLYMVGKLPIGEIRAYLLGN